MNVSLNRETSGASHESRSKRRRSKQKFSGQVNVAIYNNFTTNNNREVKATYFALNMGQSRPSSKDRTKTAPSSKPSSRKPSECSKHEEAKRPTEIVTSHRHFHQKKTSLIQRSPMGSPKLSTVGRSGLSQQNDEAPRNSPQRSPVAKPEMVTEASLNLDSLEPDETERLKREIKQYIKEYRRLPPTTIDYYKFVKLVGKGAFGKVTLGIHKLTGKKVAIKTIEKSYMKDDFSRKKVL